jgi:ParB-like chromosome segregation protein Spo0J
MQIELHQLELRYQELRAVDPARRRQLLAAICEVGQQVPVVVVAAAGVAATPARYVLIDGYARVFVLRSLRHDMVFATVWPMSEAEALIARFHLEGRARSTLEEAWLCEHLVTAETLTLAEIAQHMCRTKSWVSRRLGLHKVLWPELRTKIALGQIPPQAAMKSLLPLARANAAHARQLVDALGKHRISVRQLGRLYAAYRAADAVGRARLCASPLVFLQLEAQTERDDQAVATSLTGVDRVLADLGAAAGVCGRARRRARTELSQDELWVARDRVGTALGAARAAFALLDQELTGRLSDDRPRAADGDLHAREQGPGQPSDRPDTQALAQHGPSDSA